MYKAIIYSIDKKHNPILIKVNEPDLKHGKIVDGKIFSIKYNKTRAKQAKKFDKVLFTHENGVVTIYDPEEESSSIE